MSLHPFRLTVLALLIATTPFAAFAQGECAEFNGLEHCAIGGAQLAQCGGGLCVVDNVDLRSDAGFSASFAEGVVWTSAMSIAESDGGSTHLTASARSQGELTSTNTVRRTEDGSLGFSATFTGAVKGRTYSVQVYNGGVYQGGAGGIGDGAEYLWIPTNDEDLMMWLIAQWGFYFRMADGACGWDLDLNETRTLRLADGTVLEGDEIRLQEEVKGDGHYAYTGFDGIDIVGNATSLTLTSASVLP